uniref:Uncharacterized protein n=1 Tax=Octopus bimaculoides TaxID=37653 RepID=A0A0L8FSD1_OCTBM
MIAKLLLRVSRSCSSDGCDEYDMYVLSETGYRSCNKKQSCHRKTESGRRGRMTRKDDEEGNEEIQKEGKKERNKETKKQITRTNKQTNNETKDERKKKKGK